MKYRIIKDRLLQHIKEMDSKVLGGMLLDNSDFIEFYELTSYFMPSEVKKIVKEARQ